jgi:hypothetical protein
MPTRTGHGSSDRAPVQQAQTPGLLPTPQKKEESAYQGFLVIPVTGSVILSIFRITALNNDFVFYFVED